MQKGSKSFHGIFEKSIEDYINFLYRGGFKHAPAAFLPCTVLARETV